MKTLGKVSYPEQYALADGVFSFNDSVEVYEFFHGLCEVEGDVFLVKVHFNSLKYPALFMWVYVDVDAQNPISMIPIDKDLNPRDVFDAQITKIEPILNDIIFLQNNIPMVAIFTDTGEILLRRLRLLLNAADLLTILELENSVTATDFYPVEIYSHSLKRFILAAWAIETEEYEGVLWYPICSDNLAQLETYGENSEDLEQYPIDLKDTVTIDGVNYILLTNKDLGFFFMKNEAKAKVVQLNPSLKKTDSQNKAASQKKNNVANKKGPQNNASSAKIIKMNSPWRR